MDFEDTPEEARFRAAARAWLADTAPAHVVQRGVRLDDADEVARGRAWQRALHDGGYAGIALPNALGGRGGTMLEAVVFGEEEFRYDLPKGPYINIGIGMALPAIIRHGTAAQRDRFCTPTLRGDLTWCQLFSEPAAGSDLAALRMKATRYGDGWLLNGQKVWSSWAHLSDWGILVARSDPTLPKHKGLTFFVVDMRSPGIDIRPIRQISGASDFNEVFFTDVFIPDSDRVGAEGEGWACCMTVLTGERLNQGGGERGRTREMIRYAANTPEYGQTAMDNAAIRYELAQALAGERGEKYFQARLRTMLSRGENPGALASVVKLAHAARNQRTTGLAIELGGPYAIAPDPGDGETRRIQDAYIWSTVVRIAGGSDEVLRNQVAERLLGMPGEPRFDKDIPFNELS